MKTNTISVNNTEILVYTHQSGKVVSIKPICKAIGVDYSRQLKKIKNDDILNAVMGLTPTTGIDNKTYEMVFLPLKYIFGWLFTINPKNVKPEIKLQIIQYKRQCYNALFDIFTKRDSLLQEKTNYQLEIKKLEKELKTNEHFKKIEELKIAVKITAKKFNALNKNVIVEQLRLFEN